MFSRRLDDQTVTLAVDDEGLVDLETGTRWDPVRVSPWPDRWEATLSTCCRGFTAFEKDFPTFWPDGRIWQP